MYEKEIKLLFKTFRNILRYLSEYPQEIITGTELKQFTGVCGHDIIRRLVEWNFLTPIRDEEVPEYEQSITITDFEISYKITSQVKEFWNLELNKINDLCKAILILLRASYLETTPGWSIERLAMMLNKAPRKVFQALKLLESENKISGGVYTDEKGNDLFSLGWGWARITDKGMSALEKERGIMKLNNIKIEDSIVGVLAIESVVGNIDNNITTIKKEGNADFVKSLQKLIEAVTSSGLSNELKKETLEQIEVLSSEATRPGEHRKNGVIKAVLGFLEKTLSSTTNLATIWDTCKTSILAFFGVA